MGEPRTTAPRPARPRVTVIGTGGTISFRGRHSLDLYEYGDHGRILDVDELLAGVPEIQREADVLPVTLTTLPSSATSPADWLALHARVREVVAETEPTGVVVTHGTATLEETAYFLHLTLNVATPVVLVGAQRPSNGLSTDASLNLLNAVRIAASAAARGLGVLVALNDQIHAAREVTKTSNHRLETFRAPDLGMLGYADVDGEIAIYRRPTRRGLAETEFDVTAVTELPRVDIAYSYPGSDGTAIDAFVNAGARGLVLASLAPGRLTPGEAAAVAAARRHGVVVVLSSRAGSGRVVPRARLAEQGIVAADNLSPQKARVLTMLALTRTDDVEQVGRMFREY